MSKTINILIAIDTDAVISSYKNPSQDPNNPTGIGHQFGFMVATGTKVNSGQGTGDLSITALVGDTVRAFGVSGSNNFEDAVLVYGMPRYAGVQVFGTFISQMFTKSTVVPGSAKSPLPPSTQVQPFWFYQSSIVAKGTENYKVQFGLWTRDDSGQPKLYGYFDWDPQITVAG